MVAGAGQAFAGTTLTPNTTLSAETSNNTSASSSFTGTSNGNIAPANISKVNIKTLMYPGFSGKVYAHFMAWFGGSNHINVGYSSDSTTQVQKQVTDMMSRGIDGAIVDWYGPNATRENTTTQYLKTQAEAESGAFQFGVDYDGGALKACYNTSGCSVTQQAISDLTYAYNNYEQSPAYIKVSGRPVVLTFGTEAYPLDWPTIVASLPGNPMFVFRNSGGFTKTDSSGGYSWVAPETVTSTDPLALNYLKYFLSTSLTYPSELPVASGYAGFNDSIASWSHHYYIPQNCGQSWMTTLSQAGKYYSSNPELWGTQLVTWNDYEEGTEIETGITNCGSVSASMSGTTLSWSIGGTQANVVDHFTLFISADGVNLMSLGNVPATQTSLDLGPFGFASGTYQVFVKAVGKPTMTNHMSSAVSFTVADLSPTVSVSATPTTGIAPAAVSATATATSTSSTISSVSIDFGDGTVASGSSAAHTYSTAGNYTIKATATDSTGNTASSTTSVAIAANQPPQTVLSVSPATTTVGTAVTASTANSTDSDGSIASSTIDFGDGTIVSGSTASHAYAKAGSYTVKGTTTDNLGASSSQTATVSVTNPATISIASPLNGATIVGPVTVSASANSPNTIVAMQIYVDGTKVYQQSSSPLNTSLNLTVGTHKVTVKAWDNLSNSWMQTNGITVNANQPPVVSLAVTPTSGMASLLVSASTSGSYDPDGSIASSTINFGDGTVVSGTSASHTYTKYGTYTVTGTVTDNLGASTSKSMTVTVNCPPPVVTVSSPTSGSIVYTFMKVAATALSQRGIAAMQVYVDGKKVYQVNAASISTTLSLAKGTHYVVIQAWDTAGAYTKSAVLSVTSK